MKFSYVVGCLLRTDDDLEDRTVSSYMVSARSYEPISDKAANRVSIQDDDNGHLIYVPGDLLKARCTTIKHSEYVLFV